MSPTVIGRRQYVTNVGLSETIRTPLAYSIFCSLLGDRVMFEDSDVQYTSRKKYREKAGGMEKSAGRAMIEDQLREKTGYGQRTRRPTDSFTERGCKDNEDIQISVIDVGGGPGWRAGRHPCTRKVQNGWKYWTRVSGVLCDWTMNEKVTWQCSKDRAYLHQPRIKVGLRWSCRRRRR